MVRTALFRKEVGQLVRAWQLPLFLVVATVLSCAAFLAAARAWTERGDLVRALELSNRQQLGLAESWEGVASTGVLVAASPSAGAFLLAPQVWPAFVVRHPDLPVTVGEAGQTSGFAPGLVVIYLFTLLAVLASFDAVAGERARRTLALLLAVARSRWEVLLAKVAARVLVVGGGTAAALLTGALTVSVARGAFVADPTFAPAAAVLVVGGVLLTAVFVVIGVALSAAVRDPLTALLGGVGIWAALLVAAPGVLGALARQIAPPPSPVLLGARAQLLYTDAQRRIGKRQRQPLERWLHEGPGAQAWAQRQFARIRKEETARLARQLSELEADFRRREARTHKVASLLVGWLPQELVRGAGLAAAGRDWQSREAYLDAVQAYWEQFGKLVAAKVRGVQFLMPGAQGVAPGGRPDLGSIPEFIFRPARGALLRVAPQLAALGLWGLAALFVAARRFSRLDPR